MKTPFKSGYVHLHPRRMGYIDSIRGGELCTKTGISLTREFTISDPPEMREAGPVQKKSKNGPVRI